VTGFLFLAASAALLIAGAELFAENATGAGRRLGVSFLAVGLILAVHQVAGLNQLGMPGLGQPAWAALMAKMRRKTLIVCAPCHEHIHANPVAHAA
jgi:AI2M/AI1M-like, HNH endonuclease